MGVIQINGAKVRAEYEAMTPEQRLEEKQRLLGLQSDGIAENTAMLEDCHDLLDGFKEASSRLNILNPMIIQDEAAQKREVEAPAPPGC